MIKKALIILISTLFLTSCSQNNFDISNYKIATLNIDQTKITLAIADTPQLQSQGFMHIQNIPKEQGMLFKYDSSKPRNFWMKNTYVPLDIIFLNSQKEIINIHHDTPPCQEIDPTQNQCPSYSSIQPAQYIIELPSPQAKNLNLKPAKKLNFQTPQDLTETTN